MVTNKAILGAVGAIVGIAYFMDYANTFHSFAEWSTALAPDEMNRRLYSLVLSAVQPISMDKYSGPLALLLVAVFVVGVLFGRRR